MGEARRQAVQIYSTEQGGGASVPRA